MSKKRNIKKDKNYNLYIAMLCDLFGIINLFLALIMALCGEIIIESMLVRIKIDICCLMLIWLGMILLFNKKVRREK
jgi:hypothetical protein